MNTETTSLPVAATEAEHCDNHGVPTADGAVKSCNHGDSAVNPPAAPDAIVTEPNATAMVTDAPAAETLTAETPAGDGTPNESQLIDALRTVIDPELMINVVDLGLVYSVEQEGDAVKVEMTLTSPACPAGPQIVSQAKIAVERLAGVREATIKLTLNPPWTPDRMTDEARDQLGIF